MQARHSRGQPSCSTSSRGSPNGKSKPPTQRGSRRSQAPKDSNVGEAFEAVEPDTRRPRPRTRRAPPASACAPWVGWRSRRRSTGSWKGAQRSPIVAGAAAVHRRRRGAHPAPPTPPPSLQARARCAACREWLDRREVRDEAHHRGSGRVHAVRGLRDARRPRRLRPKCGHWHCNCSARSSRCWSPRSSRRAVYRVPMLRNIAKTAPYFHDGSVEKLPGGACDGRRAARSHAARSRRHRHRGVSRVAHRRAAGALRAGALTPPSAPLAPISRPGRSISKRSSPCAVRPASRHPAAR